MPLAFLQETVTNYTFGNLVEVVQRHEGNIRSRTHRKPDPGYHRNPKFKEKYGDQPPHSKNPYPRG